MKDPRGELPYSLRRREVIGLAAAGAAAATLVPLTRAQSDAAGSRSVSVPVDGKYRAVALRQDVLRVTAVQSVIRPPRDMKNPARELKANLDHMLELVDQANGFAGPQDLVCFHEQPIMGWNDWTLEESLRLAIDVPGPETEALGRRAKQYGCYISFGTYARDEHWLGHLLLTGVLIGPNGEVVANHWKTNNGRGLRPRWDIFTTSIYDVLDRYREMYGEDAVLPIARTDIGNISCSVTPFQPDVMRAHAMKGLELSLRSSSGGYSLEDAQMTSQYNRIYMVVCNNAVSPGHPSVPEFSGCGDTAIFGPNGRIVSRARSFNEEFVTTTLPIGDFRRTRTLPEVPMAMLMPVYRQYRPRYDPNLQTDYQPKDSADAAKHFSGKRNW